MRLFLLEWSLALNCPSVQVTQSPRAPTLSSLATQPGAWMPKFSSRLDRSLQVQVFCQLV